MILNDMSLTITTLNQSGHISELLKIVSLDSLLNDIVDVSIHIGTILDKVLNVFYTVLVDCRKQTHIRSKRKQPAWFDSEC